MWEAGTDLPFGPSMWAGTVLVTTIECFEKGEGSEGIGLECLVYASCHLGVGH